MSLDSVIDRLRKATKWQTDAEKRETAAMRVARAEAWAKWQAGDRQESFVEPLLADGDSDHGRFLEKLGISAEDVDKGDPYAEGRSFLAAAEQYDRRLAKKLSSLHEVAVSAENEKKRRRADSDIAWIEAEREALEKLTDKVWSRVYRPLSWGAQDEDEKALAKLRCRCSPDCPRLFSDVGAKEAASGRHPLCVEEAQAERLAETHGDGAYVSSLLERLV